MNVFMKRNGELGRVFRGGPEGLESPRDLFFRGLRGF
jgi:hypothetical protein